MNGGGASAAGASLLVRLRARRYFFFLKRMRLRIFLNLWRLIFARFAFLPFIRCWSVLI